MPMSPRYSLLQGDDGEIENDWKPIATLILNSIYEATFNVAVLRAHQTKLRQTLYLTKVGGGVFDNPEGWIIESINRSLKIHTNSPIDVVLVHHEVEDPNYKQFLPVII
jgi:hypothetical protein